MKIHDKKNEPLLSRVEVSADIEFAGATPSYQDVTKGVASHMKADEKLVVVRHVYTEFGNKKAKVQAYVYSDEAKKQFFEPKLKVKKDKAAEAKK